MRCCRSCPSKHNARFICLLFGSYISVSFISSTYPRASAPDHWRRKPRRADIRTADALLKSHLKDKTPGGSSHGIRGSRKKMVIGVVFHINLHEKSIQSRNYSNQSEKKKLMLIEFCLTLTRSNCFVVVSWTIGFCLSRSE